MTKKNNMTVTKYLDLLDILAGIAPDALVEEMEKAGIVEQVVDIKIIDYSPGAPGCWYLKNGDPGYPDEPAEWEQELAENYGCRVMARLYSAAASNANLRTELTRYRGVMRNVADDIIAAVNEAAEALDVELYEVEEAI